MRLYLVLVTVPNAEKGGEIARALLERKLCACVNVVSGLRSLYWWEGKIADDAEVLLLIKTTEEKLSALEAAVVELHPYDTPEFIAIEGDRVQARYMAWVQGSVRGA